MARASILAAACAGLVSCNLLLGMGDLELKAKADGGAGDDDWAFPEYDAGSRINDSAVPDGSTDGGPVTQKRIFLTSTTFNGGFGSLQAADGKCRELAATANLGGDWIAWLGAGPNRAYDLLTFEGPYVLLNGTTVATSKQAFITGALLAPINVFETGAPAPTTNKVWTGTRANGESGEACSSTTTTAWDNATPFKIGTAGDMDQKDGRWTDNNGEPFVSSFGWLCSLPGRLYCFER